MGNKYKGKSATVKTKNYTIEQLILSVANTCLLGSRSGGGEGGGRKTTCNAYAKGEAGRYRRTLSATSLTQPFQLQAFFKCN